MSIDPPQPQDHEPTYPSALRECVILAKHVSGSRSTALVLILLGLGAALAETLSVGLAVMLLFALLKQTEQIEQAGGLLAEVHRLVQGIFGSDPYIIASVFFVLILFNAALVYANHVTTATMMNRVAQRMRNLVHKQYVSVGYRYLQKFEHGELINTLATETWTASDAFYHLARIGVNFSMVLVFSIGLFTLSWIVGVTALICAAIVFIFLRLLSHPVRLLSNQTLAANQILAERMLVSLHGMRTLRAFAQEEYLLRVFGSASLKVRKLAARTERIKALTGPIGEVGSLGSLIVIALVAGWAGVEVPTIITAVLLLFRLQPHLREIETGRMSLAGMSAPLRAVREMLDDTDKPYPTEGAIPFAGLKSDIRFESVSFSHDPRYPLSLDAVSFVIRQGETTTLSGPSGSGKTTILNLLLRLYEPDTGKILVDGIDLNSCSRASWLSRLAIAGQDVELIEGTVAQNIRLGAHDAKLEDVHRVCEMVEILEDIRSLPDGFDSKIGAGGLNFSGGQRQRIGLARALLRDPEFLILDEAMSAIEPAREDRIRRRIDDMMDGRTLLIISHRSDPAIDAINVISIKDGRVLNENALKNA